jgi:polysaccharide biosynthesis protein PelF
MSVAFPKSTAGRVAPPAAVAVPDAARRVGDRRPAHLARPGVTLVTEGTYPHSHGGVSVWCDQVVTGLPEHRFRIVALTAFSHVRPVYDLPAHAEDLVTVGLWDISRPRPTRRRPPVGDSLAARLASLLTDAEDDVTGFGRFLDEVAHLAPPKVADQLSFRELLPALDAEVGVTRWAATEGARVADLVRAAHMLDHFLRALWADAGPAHVYHASSNGLASLVCMIARRRHGGQFLLTEHGIYLRERYLELRRSDLARPARALLMRFHRLACAAAYAEASVIAPGSEWNQRWEARHGAHPRRLRTIYNGIDPDEFPAPGDGPSDPVISWLGRVDPIKDLETLIQGFQVVHRAMPEARLRLYGRTPPGNEGYRTGLDALVEELGLTGAVTFEGGVARSADAHAGARLSVLSSISEGFPYSLIEAMACGLPAVATGVGGVAEAVADTGVVVLPRAPELLGEALLALVNDPERCRRLGAEARRRVHDHFTLASCLDGYRDVYGQLTSEDIALVPLDGGLAHPREAAAGPPPPLRPDALDALVSAVGGAEAMAAAIDTDEVAATLESVGVTDQVAVDRFGSPDVFDLAERAREDARKDAAAHPRRRPPEVPPGPPEPTVASMFARGLGYVLPAIVVAAAQLHGVAQAALVAASALGWGAGQAGGTLGYTALHRSPPGSGLAPLRRGLAGCVGLILLGAAVTGVRTTPAAAAAFAFPLLNLVVSSGLVMAGRTRLLVALIAPVSALSVAALVRPSPALVGLVGPASGLTVAVGLVIVGVIARRGPPARRTLRRADWLAALPLMGCGWLTAAFALLAVATLHDLAGLQGMSATQWLVLALPLWVSVAAGEWLLVGLRTSLRPLLVRTTTVRAFRRRARGPVIQHAELTTLLLQAAVWAATWASSLPAAVAWRASTQFFLVALALIAGLVLGGASRIVPVVAVIGPAVAALALVASPRANPFHVADHTAGLVVCAAVAIALWVAAALAATDPGSHR